MRSIGLILLIFAAFAWAEEPPPIPPRIMLIHLNDSTTDSILCSQIDPVAGVTFLDKSKMKVNLKVMHATLGIPIASTRMFCTGQIDSITFAIIGEPPVETPVASVVTERPAPK